MEEERLIPLKEAAARFGISHSHLQLLARAGRLNAKKMGRDWFTTPEAVVEYLGNTELRSKRLCKYKPADNIWGIYARPAHVETHHRRTAGQLHDLQFEQD